MQRIDSKFFDKNSTDSFYYVMHGHGYEESNFSSITFNGVAIPQSVPNVSPSYKQFTYFKIMKYGTIDEAIKHGVCEHAVGDPVVIPIDSLPDATYIVRLRSPGATGRDVRMVISNGTPSFPGLNANNSRMFYGDATCDGIVDIADYIALAHCYDMVRADRAANWFEYFDDDGAMSCPAFVDFNWDGIIDVADYNVLALNFGRVAESSP